LVHLSILLFPNSYITFGGGIRFSSILCTCPNQCNLCNPIVSVMEGFLNHCINFFISSKYPPIFFFIVIYWA
jgi:hypothetical protein